MSDEHEHDHDENENREFLPPLDFSSIVFPLYTPALIKLGLMEDPLRKTTERNLDFAKRLIDILDILKDRTKGNLDEEEEKFLESCLLQLKMNYMKQAEILKM